jgi:hypothetical protein
LYKTGRYLALKKLPLGVGKSWMASDKFFGPSKMGKFGLEAAANMAATARASCSVFSRYL